MDVIHALSARYCIRQDARGFIELWLLAVLLAGAIVAIWRGIRDRQRKRMAMFWVAALTCAIVFTCGFGLTIFRWCYESAAPSLGMMVPDAPKGIDAMICFSSHARELIDGWILIVVSCIAAIALLVLGFRGKGVLRRAVSFAGSGLGLLFATANGGLMLFGVSWCQSSRLF